MAAAKSIKLPTFLIPIKQEIYKMEELNALTNYIVLRRTQIDKLAVCLVGKLESVAVELQKPQQTLKVTFEIKNMFNNVWKTCRNERFESTLRTSMKTFTYILESIRDNLETD